jgi:hypothetical protein
VAGFISVSCPAHGAGNGAWEVWEIPPAPKREAQKRAQGGKWALLMFGQCQKLGADGQSSVPCPHTWLLPMWYVLSWGL